MDEALYNVMNWPEIEAIVYSEHDNPHHILGAHKLESGYFLINGFFPNTKSVEVLLNNGKKYMMECTDEAGFYSVIIPRKTKPVYTYKVTYEDGVEAELIDPYNFNPVITEKDCELFAEGIHYTIYEKLGAHKMTIDGVEGVMFAVWAPNAMRVSVVGDFNSWDGRRNPMRRLGQSGIHEVFIPGLEQGLIYKYEIKVKGGLTILKADPYGYCSELRPATASVIYDIDGYQWTDAEWIEHRKNENSSKKPMMIYEVHLASWKREKDAGESEFMNYREIAPLLAEYVISMGYTHIEIMPIMEHPFDGSWGYQVTGYYAVTSRYGTPDDFMYFMDYMHSKGIAVILDWVPAHFPRDAHGLARFDGTCLYEHLDPRQGEHPHWGTLIYNYGRPQVSNFLIANGLFWIEKYHADGIRMDAVASMLYLDYGKNDGEWIANKFGSNENLEAIEFLKHFNSVNKKLHTGAMIMAEESTAWANITTDVDADGLGFNYKWNMGWMNDFLDYMKTDPLFRKGKHGELVFSMVYAYSEKFILVLSHDEVVHGKGSLINKMPGEYEQKFDNLRAAYGFMIGHPGKKLLFMGQDLAQFSEWSECKGIEWELLEVDAHNQMHNYMKELLHFYKQHPALYELDHNCDGFEWISNMDADHSVVAFLRKTEKEDETLLFVYNFTPVAHEKFLVGVPYHGKYKEVFSSDYTRFGGKNEINPRVKTSKKVPWDGRTESIEITVPPLGMSVFTCQKVENSVKSSKVKGKEGTKKKATSKSRSTKSTKKK